MGVKILLIGVHNWSAKQFSDFYAILSRRSGTNLGPWYTTSAKQYLLCHALHNTNKIHTWLAGEGKKCDAVFEFQMLSMMILVIVIQDVMNHCAC